MQLSQFPAADESNVTRTLFREGREIKATVPGEMQHRFDAT
jgi:hypothetical protein